MARLKDDGLMMALTTQHAFHGSFNLIAPSHPYKAKASASYSEQMHELKPQRNVGS